MIILPFFEQLQISQRLNVLHYLCHFYKWHLFFLINSGQLKENQKEYEATFQKNDAETKEQGGKNYSFMQHFGKFVPIHARGRGEDRSSASGYLPNN